MLLNTIAKKYPNNYVILSPNKRNSDGAVSDWKVWMYRPMSQRSSLGFTGIF